MVLKECPHYRSCSSGEYNTELNCDGCNCYKCYELGFMQGVKEAVKKINELPESILRPMTATEYRRDSEEYYHNCLRKFMTERRMKNGK